LEVQVFSPLVCWLQYELPHVPLFLFLLVTVQGFKGSPPNGIFDRGSRFNSRPRSVFGLRIYEKSVSFVSPNPKFGAKLAITWENEHF
jgi:hypothetical protein